MGMHRRMLTALAAAALMVALAVASPSAARPADGTFRYVPSSELPDDTIPGAVRDDGLTAWYGYYEGDHLTMWGIDGPEWSAGVSQPDGTLEHELQRPTIGGSVAVQPSVKLIGPDGETLGVVDAWPETEFFAYPECCTNGVGAGPETRTVWWDGAGAPTLVPTLAVGGWLALEGTLVIGSTGTAVLGESPVAHALLPGTTTCTAGSYDEGIAYGTCDESDADRRLVQWDVATNAVTEVVSDLEQPIVRFLDGRDGTMLVAALGSVRFCWEGSCQDIPTEVPHIVDGATGTTQTISTDWYKQHNAVVGHRVVARGFLGLNGDVALTVTGDDQAHPARVSAVVGSNGVGRLGVAEELEAFIDDGSVVTTRWDSYLSNDYSTNQYLGARWWTASPRQFFSDVPPDHAFGEEITLARERGLVNGYPDGTYHPLDVVSRQAAVAMLYRLRSPSPPPAPACTAAPFSDVPIDHPFCAETAWAKARGITGGYADGTFRPTAQVSRNAMAVMLGRHVQIAQSATCAPPFTDVIANTVECTMINTLAYLKIIDGYPNHTFRGTNPVNRSQLAAWLTRTRPPTT